MYFFFCVLCAFVFIFLCCPGYHNMPSPYAPHNHPGFVPFPSPHPILPPINPNSPDLVLFEGRLIPRAHLLASAASANPQILAPPPVPPNTPADPLLQVRNMYLSTNVKLGNLVLTW